MSDANLEKIAGELADLAIADERRTGDENIVTEVSEIVGASSQTLQEAFLTAVRVRRAEKRARALLAERATDQLAKTAQLLTDETQEPDTKAAPTEKAGQTDVDTSALEALMDDLDQQNAQSPSPGIKPGRPGRG